MRYPRCETFRSDLEVAKFIWTWWSEEMFSWPAEFQRTHERFWKRRKGVIASSEEMSIKKIGIHEIINRMSCMKGDQRKNGYEELLLQSWSLPGHAPHTILRGVSGHKDEEDYFFFAWVTVQQWLCGCQEAPWPWSPQEEVAGGHSGGELPHISALHWAMSTARYTEVERGLLKLNVYYASSGARKNLRDAKEGEKLESTIKWDLAKCWIISSSVSNQNKKAEEQQR